MSFLFHSPFLNGLVSAYWRRAPRPIPLPYTLNPSLLPAIVFESRADAQRIAQVPQLHLSLCLSCLPLCVACRHGIKKEPFVSARVTQSYETGLFPRPALFLFAPLLPFPPVSFERMSKCYKADMPPLSMKACVARAAPGLSRPIHLRDPHFCSCS